MILSDPTTGLLSPSLAKLLQVLVSEGAPRTGRELARIAEVSSAQGDTLLRRLAGLGVVIETPKLPAKLYEINSSHILVPQLRALIGGLDSILEQLTDKVEGLQTAPEIAILFGSAMRGEDHEDSDLDLYLLFSDSVPLDKGQLLETTADVSEHFYALTGNSLNVLVQKMSDLRTNFESRSRFLTNLLSDGRVLKGARVLTRLKEEYQWSNTPKGQSN